MSVIITIINPTKALIEGPYDDRALDDHFAFRKSDFWWKSRAAQFGWDGKTHMFDRANRTIPIGLVRAAAKLLKGWGHKVKVFDRRAPSAIRIRPETSRLGGGIELRDYQLRAVERAVRMERGIIHGGTGCGKTECAAAIIERLGRPVTLFLTGRKKLARQTRERFAERLSVPVDDIGFIQGGQWHNGALPVYVAVVNTLTQKKFERDRRIMYQACQLMFLDEAHHAGSTMWYRVAMYCRARYRIGLTGTPIGRSDAGDLYLKACTGGVIARIQTKQLIDKGLLAHPTVYFTKIKGRAVQPLDNSWAQVYHHGIVTHERRNNVIVRYAEALQKQRKPTLVLVRELAHGYALKDRIAGSCFVHGGTLDHDLEKTLRSFEAGKLPTLIATSIFDEGVDIPMISALLIASGGKSMITTIQRIGRGLRKKQEDNRLFVFDFYDRHNDYLRRHSERRIDICRKEKFDVVMLTRQGDVRHLVA